MFGAELHDFGKKAMLNTERVRRAAIIELVNGLVARTPVDDGRARGNWQTSVNSPKTEEIERIQKAAGIGAEQAAEVTQNTGKMEESVFVTNNLPYITDLNNGSSSQAPAGFVEQEVARVQQNLDRRGAKL